MHYQTLLGPDPNEVNSGRCGSKMAQLSLDAITLGG